MLSVGTIWRPSRSGNYDYLLTAYIVATNVGGENLEEIIPKKWDLDYNVEDELKDIRNKNKTVARVLPGIREELAAIHKDLNWIGSTLQKMGQMMEIIFQDKLNDTR